MKWSNSQYFGRMTPAVSSLFISEQLFETFVVNINPHSWPTHTNRFRLKRLTHSLCSFRESGLGRGIIFLTSNLKMLTFATDQREVSLVLSCTCIFTYGVISKHFELWQLVTDTIMCIPRNPPLLSVWMMLKLLCSTVFSPLLTGTLGICSV